MLSPGATYRRAVQKAGSDAELAALVRGWLERYLAPWRPKCVCREP